MANSLTLARQVHLKVIRLMVLIITNKMELLQLPILSRCLRIGTCLTEALTLLTPTCPILRPKACRHSSILCKAITHHLLLTLKVLLISRHRMELLPRTLVTRNQADPLRCTFRQKLRGPSPAGSFYLGRFPFFFLKLS